MRAQGLNAGLGGPAQIHKIDTQGLGAFDHVAPQGLNAFDHVAPQGLDAIDHIAPQGLNSFDHVGAQGLQIGLGGHGGLDGFEALLRLLQRSGDLRVQRGSADKIHHGFRLLFRAANLFEFPYFRVGVECGLRHVDPP